MATVPLSGTNITLLSGIPFSNDYKNTRWFVSTTDQFNYFSTQTIISSITQANFQRIEGKTFISVNMPIDSLWGTNYLMFQNASYNDKWFYAFVTKLEYVQHNTTYVHFEIDVLQTWITDMTFKPSYVVREHCTLWNADGSPVINTIDEGLYYGSEYDTVYSKHYDSMNSNGVFFLVMIAKSSLHIPAGATQSGVIISSLNGSPQSLCYYVHPFMMDGTQLNASIDGGSSQILSGILTLLSTIFSQTTSVNNIVSMYVTENVGIPTTVNINTSPWTVDFTTAGDPLGATSSFEVVSISDGTQSVTSLFIDSLPTYQTSEINAGAKYYGLTQPVESKLYMYPYTLTILDDFKGNRVVLKNEYIDNPTLYIEVMGSLGVSNKVAYIPRDYTTDYITDVNEKARIALEHSLINNNAQDVPILVDMLAAYLQGNKNSLANQTNTIVFNGVLGEIGNTITGVASAAQANPVGVAGAGVNVVKGAGDTALALQAIQAKLKDIGNVPPQLAKMGSNTAFSFGNTYTGFYVIKKQIKPEYSKKLTDYFNMFGYKKNEVKIPNFNTRQSWNYVETKSCNITGNFNNEDLQELKNIFDNGIFLWHTNDVGNFALANGVI
jgi:hypothetical protein